MMLSSVVVFVIFAISMLSFFALNEYALVRLVAPPDEKCVPRSKRHKWRNEVASLVHSLIVGLGAVHCFIQYQRSENGDESYFGKIEIFAAISAGYVVYDTIDLMQHNPLYKVSGVLLHHVMVFACFYTTYVTGMFYKLAIFAMLVDVSSVFLHLRMLLIMHGFDDQHPARVVNTLVNIVAFVIFRLLIIVYIMIAVFYDSGAFVVAIVASLFVAILLVVNIILLRRLVISDYMQTSSLKDHADEILETS